MEGCELFERFALALADPSAVLLVSTAIDGSRDIGALLAVANESGTITRGDIVAGWELSTGERRV